jgi:hypothetical protein
MGKDKFHNVVRNSLEKDGWNITADDVEEEVISQWL